MSLKKSEIKKTLKTIGIDLGVLESDSYIDEDSTFLDLGFGEEDFQSLITELESELGILFDQDLDVKMTIGKFLDSDYS